MNPYRSVNKDKQKTLTTHLLNCNVCRVKVSGWDEEDFADERSAKYLVDKATSICNNVLRRVEPNVPDDGSFSKTMIDMIVEENQ